MNMDEDLTAQHYHDNTGPLDDWITSFEEQTDCATFDDPGSAWTHHHQRYSESFADGQLVVISSDDDDFEDDVYDKTANSTIAIDAEHSLVGFHRIHRFEDVNYTTYSIVKYFLIRFPLDVNVIMKFSHTMLRIFLALNKIRINSVTGKCPDKELMAYKVKSFLDNKMIHLLMNRGDQPNSEPNHELVTEDMLRTLTPEAQLIFNELQIKNEDEIRNTLLAYGSNPDPSLSKGRLLEVYYNILSENVQAESGIGKKKEGSASGTEKESSHESLVNECCVCMEKKLESCILPCGHVVLCEKCSSQVRQCPICRGSVHSIVPVFFS